MSTLFAVVLSLQSVTLPPADGREAARDVFAPVAAVEQDPLGDLAASFDGVPVPVVDPFQSQVMVEVRGTF